MQPVFDLFTRKTGKTAMNTLVFAAFFKKNGRAKPRSNKTFNTIYENL
tara:strand:- start:155 stop:298 length:144 start_codon:yes stop_codon:yes gene_type:complete